MTTSWPPSGRTPAWQQDRTSGRGGVGDITFVDFGREFELDVAAGSEVVFVYLPRRLLAERSTDTRKLTRLALAGMLEPPPATTRTPSPNRSLIEHAIVDLVLAVIQSSSLMQRPRRGDGRRQRARVYDFIERDPARSTVHRVQPGSTSAPATSRSSWRVTRSSVYGGRSAVTGSGMASHPGAATACRSARSRPERVHRVEPVSGTSPASSPLRQRAAPTGAARMPIQRSRAQTLDQSVAAARPPSVRPIGVADGLYPSRWIRGSDATCVATRSVIVIPPPGHRSGARWSSQLRKRRTSRRRDAACVRPAHPVRGDLAEHGQSREGAARP